MKRPHRANSTWLSPSAHRRGSRPLRALIAALTTAALTLAAIVATASAATTTTTGAATVAASTTSTTATATSAATTTVTTPAAVDASSGAPKVTLSPTGSGKGQTTTIAVDVERCPPGSIKITDTVNHGSQRIRKDGAAATVVSHGYPGTYSITATCANGAHASASFVVTKYGAPSVRLSPSSTGPVPKTVHVSVQGCPPGTIEIRDTINGGTQTIKKDGAPATIPSPGMPGKYQVTARCAADRASADAGFVVTHGRPVVTLHPSSTGPVTRTIRVVVTGCPAGRIKITDTINGGTQRIKHDRAPATIVSQGYPGTYQVTARCADGANGHAQFVVTPNGPIQTGGGSAFSRGAGPQWTAWTGIAMLALGLAGGLGLAVGRGRGRRRHGVGRDESGRARR